MCVAIIKPTNAKLPTEETLQACWDTNPDGAGIAVFNKVLRKVEINKGFMKWDEFKTFYQSSNLENELVFFHFRIATAGGVNAGNTHPFPFSNDIATLKSENLLTDFAIMHNGVFPIIPQIKTISDTMQLILNLWNSQNGIKKRNPLQALRLIKDFLGSNKVALMDNAGKVNFFGKWEKVEGCYFSNLNHEWRLNWQDNYFDNNSSNSNYWKNKFKVKKTYPLW